MNHAAGSDLAEIAGNERIYTSLPDKHNNYVGHWAWRWFICKIGPELESMWYSHKHLCWEGRWFNGSIGCVVTTERVMKWRKSRQASKSTTT
jgi:hypothetical protein